SAVGRLSRTARRTGRRTKPRTRRSRLQSPARPPASRRSPPSRADVPSPIAWPGASVDAHSLADRRVPRPVQPSAVAAFLGSEPWRECGTHHHSAERPKSTPRYAAVSTSVAPGAPSLVGRHDRLEAREPGGREPVKAASRRPRARALTGLRSSGNGLLQAIIARRGRRGVGIYDCAQACAKLEAASQKCTSSRRVDPNALFRSPTGAHLAPFILHS